MSVAAHVQLANSAASWRPNTTALLSKTSTSTPPMTYIAMGLGLMVALMATQHVHYMYSVLTMSVLAPASLLCDLTSSNDAVHAVCSATSNVCLGDIRLQGASA